VKVVNGLKLGVAEHGGPLAEAEFSVEKPAVPGSALSGNRQFDKLMST
jgi:hypothetical protein